MSYGDAGGGVLCLQTAHFGNPRFDETVFTRDITLTRISVVPRGLRPHPDLRPNFVSCPFAAASRFSGGGACLPACLPPASGVGETTASPRGPTTSAWHMMID